MFKSASFFRIASTFVMPPLEALEAALQARRFLPCGATQPESSGWVAPRGGKSSVLAEAVGRQIIVRLCTERRPLPASAIKDAVAERIERYKQETGRDRVGARIKKEIKDEVIQALLPRAFTKRSSTTLWIDPVSQLLAVDSGSLTGADKVVSHLVDALGDMPGVGPGIGVKPLQTALSAAVAMAHWLASREAPYRFTVDRDCELKMPDDQKSAVRYSRHTLEIDEVAAHIAAGKAPTQLAMTWHDRVSFVLTDTAQIRKIKLLDVVLDGLTDKGKDDDGFDADAAIVTGELSALIADLLQALGGELPGAGAAPAPLAAHPGAADAQVSPRDTERFNGPRKKQVGAR